MSIKWGAAVCLGAVIVLARFYRGFARESRRNYPRNRKY
jgi:hypothetical protein